MLRKLVNLDECKEGLKTEPEISRDPVLTYISYMCLIVTVLYLHVITILFPHETFICEKTIHLFVPLLGERSVVSVRSQEMAIQRDLLFRRKEIATALGTPSSGAFPDGSVG